MAEVFSNNASGNLNAGITNGATSLVLQAGQGSTFPATGNFRILIDNELIIVGARSGDTLSSLTRGAETTTAVSHASGAVVTHLLTAGTLANFVPQLQPSDVTKILKGDGSWPTGYALKQFVYIQQGTTTYAPSAGVKALYVECIGAGGQGGGTAATGAAQNAAGGGGGGGGYSAVFLTGAAVKASFTVAVGAGGSTSAAGNNVGQAGGDTTFDSPSVCTAKGGSGGGGSAVLGAAGVGGQIGAGGAASGGVGDLKQNGFYGGLGLVIAVGAINLCGYGGSSPLGGAGGWQQAGGTAPGGAALGYGAGGGGALAFASQAAQQGGAGANGLIRVLEAT